MKARFVASLAILLTAIAPASAQDLAPDGLLGAPVYADPSSQSEVIGRVSDLLVDDGTVAAIVVEDSGADSRFARIGDAQIFLKDGEPLLVIVEDALTLQPPSSPGTTSFSSLPSDISPSTRLDQQALDLTFYGNDAARVLVETLVDVRRVLGEGAFRTENYTVQSGDTICAIYAKTTSLPLNEIRCPAAVEALNEALNPNIPIAPGVTLEVPQVDLSSQKGGIRSPSSYARGISGAYSIRLPVTTQMAHDFYSSFVPSGGSVSIDFNTAGSGQAKSRYSSEAWLAPLSALACEPEAEAVSVEQSYYYLFDWLARKGWTPSEEIRACAMDCAAQNPDDPGACTDLVLIDQPPRKISDLAQVQFLDRFGQPLAYDVEPNATSCEIETFDRDSQHGTHLASIIGSRPDGRGYVGIGPGLDVISYPWISTSTTGDLILLMNKRIGNIPEDDPAFPKLGPQVFVFASMIPSSDPFDQSLPKASYPPNTREGGGLRLNNDEWRLLPTPQQSIVNSAPYSIWIVPAMQRDSNAGLPNALEINERLAFSPVNLGDQSNVIVVTACDKCDEGDASVWSDAFFSEKFVHVAAPGVGVIAPVAPGVLAEADGTSQAAAIVGGLVGAMLNCYPDRYRDTEGQSALKSDYLKQRLQYTSKPIFYEDADLRKVASGVVDPEVALLDPSANWIRMAGEDDYQKLDGDRDLKNWCLLNWTMTDQQLKTQPNFSANILRMTRIANPKVSGGRSWVIYSLVPGKKSEIDRFDPRNFADKNAASQPLLARLDGTFIYPSEFDDLVLAKTLGYEACQ